MQIELGAMCDPISKQIEDAGLKQQGKNVYLLDRLSQAITLVYIHGCITDSECRKARKRLIKQLHLEVDKVTSGDS